MKGQLGTQVKDASHSALGNRSPGAAGRAREGLAGLGSSERRGRAREPSRRGRRRGRQAAERGKAEGREAGRPGGLHHLRAPAAAGSRARTGGPTCPPSGWPAGACD